MKILIFAHASCPEHHALNVALVAGILPADVRNPEVMVWTYGTEPLANDMASKAKDFGASVIVLLTPTAAQLAEGFTTIQFNPICAGIRLIFVALNSRDDLQLRQENMEVQIERGKIITEEEYFRERFN